MTKRIFVIVLFVFCSLNILAQEEYPHLLVFKDGTEIRGKVVVWDLNRLIFRNADSNEKNTYKYKLLKTVLDFESRKEYDKGLYVLKQLKGTDRTLRLTKAISGKVECYYISRESGSSAFGTDAVSVYSIYFICKEGESEVTQVRSRLKFKKIRNQLKEYFGDCPDVISKIDDGYFGDRIESLEPLIKYYNTKC